MLVFVCDATRLVPAAHTSGDRVVVQMPPWLEHDELAPWVDRYLAEYPDHQVGLDVGDANGKAGLHLGFSLLTVLFLRDEQHRYVKGRVRSVEPPSA
jgi:hypothetical protein